MKLFKSNRVRFVGILFSALLASSTGWAAQLSPESIDFTTNPATASNSSVFSYVGGGHPVSGFYEYGTASSSGGALEMSLTLDAAQPVSFAVTQAYELNVPNVTNYEYSVTVNGDSLISNYKDKDANYHTVGWNIPSSMLKSGANTIKITPNVCYYWIIRAEVRSAIDLSTPAPPNTFATAQPDFDYLSWNMFFAMNWPANITTEGTGDSETQQRGFPDTSKDFIDSASTSPWSSVLVWETFKEKREMFIYPPDTTTPPDDWNSPPSRTFHQGSKLFNSLDETIEVASEALEEYYPSSTTANPVANPVLGRPVAPRVWLGQPEADQSNAVRYEVRVNYDFYDYLASYSYKTKTGSTQLFPLYVDDNTKALATSANPQGITYFDPPSGYETKGNNAHKSAMPFPLANTSSGNLPGPVKLPLRTTATGGAGNPNPNYGYTSDSAVSYYEQYQGLTTQIPINIGSVHIKAAWIPLTEDEAATGIYHTATAQYFEGSDPSSDAQTGLFGLVGLHIIQRLHTVGENSQIDTPGGAFLFSTWEHVNNDEAGFTYANYYDPSLDPNTTKAGPKGFYPDFTTGATVYEVNRLYDILPGTADVNAEVHSAIKAALVAAGKTIPTTPTKENPAPSPWLYYELVGTQFMGVNASKNPTLTQSANAGAVTVAQADNDPDQIGMPVYLANLVIETNLGLQQFQGTPPVTDVISHYANKLGTQTPVKPPLSASNFNYASSKIQTNPGPGFDRTALNLAYGGTGYNMGGCMGCHGVAQVRGYSFSFVLLGGQSGADPDSEVKFSIPPLQTDK